VLQGGGPAAKKGGNSAVWGGQSTQTHTHSFQRRTGLSRHTHKCAPFRWVTFLTFPRCTAPVLVLWFLPVASVAQWMNRTECLCAPVRPLALLSSVCLSGFPLSVAVVALLPVVHAYRCVSFVFSCLPVLSLCIGATVASPGGTWQVVSAQSIPRRVECCASDCDETMYALVCALTPMLLRCACVCCVRCVA
jgi:hypothetical protein